MSGEAETKALADGSGGRRGVTGDPVPRKDLTIPPERLAGSPACLNCGTILMGPFCHYCGQPDRNFLRFFPALLRELLEDFLDFDSRFVRTMKPLLFRPGKLTRDYLDGRRFRYTPPLRLYVFSSIAFFFLAALLARDIVQIGDGDGDLQVSIGEEAVPEEALDRLDPVTRAKVEKAMEEAQRRRDEAGEGTGEVVDGGIEIGGKPWDRETNPFEKEWLPGWVNDWINDEIEESPQKGKEIEANPDLIKDKVFDVLPLTMFVLLPLFALLMKFWYLFAGRYYIEHLIYALHNHSFLFVLAIIAMLLGLLQTWLDPGGEGRTSQAVEIATGVLWAWMPIYLFLSMKRVYGQGWGMTLAKFCAVGLSYTVLLGLATAFVALLSFVLL